MLMHGRGGMTKKPSKNDLERRVKSTITTTNKVMDDMVHLLTLERIHAEIHKEVNRQVAMGEITKHELMQWRLKWNSYEADYATPPEELAAALGLPSLQETYVQIYTETSKQIADIMTAYYLEMETIR